jgi:sec-independent protein translocase protein TatA
MPNVGLPEIAIVLVIALIVFGPKRLPELGKSLGRGIHEFRGTVSGERADEETPELASETAVPAPAPAERVEAAPAGRS